MRKGTIIAVGITVTLLAYVYFLEQSHQVVMETTLYSVKASEIVRIDIAENGSSLTLEKSGDSWRMPIQPDDNVDETKLSALLEMLASPKATPVDITGAIPWNRFGLSPPSKSVTIKTGSGLTRTLHVGRKSPVGWNLYVRLEGSENLYLIPDYLTRPIVTNPEKFKKEPTE